MPRLFCELDKLMRGYRRDLPSPEDNWWASEEVVFEYQRLLDRLNDQAPPGFFFGGHPNDPACLGFWPITHKYAINAV